MVKAVGCGPGSSRFNSPARQQGFFFCFRGTQLHLKLRRRDTFGGDITSLVWGIWLIEALPSPVLSNAANPSGVTNMTSFEARG